jgi:hypothetical protein
MGYTGLDLAGFKTKLKNGGYGSLTGARRAIGKAQSWDDADRAKANVMADKHFSDGSTPAAPAKKAKTPVKRQAQAAALAAKKAGAPARGQVKTTAEPVSVPPPAPARPGPGRGRMKKQVKAAGGTGARRGRPPKAAKRDQDASQPDSAELERRITVHRNAVAGLGEAGTKLQACAAHGVDISEGMNSLSSALTRLINSMQQNVVVPLTAAEARGAALLAQSAPLAVTPDRPAQPGNGVAQPTYLPPPSVFNAE